jgi:hypothetical protein
VPWDFDPRRDPAQPGTARPSPALAGRLWRPCPPAPLARPPRGPCSALAAPLARSRGPAPRRLAPSPLPRRLVPSPRGRAPRRLALPAAMPSPGGLASPWPCPLAMPPHPSPRPCAPSAAPARPRQTRALPRRAQCVPARTTIACATLKFWSS